MLSKFIKSFIVAAIAAVSVTSVAGAIHLSPEYVGVDSAITSQIAEHTATQDAAHDMAEAARTLKSVGMLDAAIADATVASAQEVWHNCQEQITSLTAAQTAMREVDIPFGPHQQTGLTASAFNKMLAGTPLAGTGASWERMEKTTGTNALFAIGVSNSESSFGAACYNHNPFGILTGGGLKYFDSWDSAIQYFGELIAGQQGVSAYARATSIEGINDIYCPGDGHYWSQKVRATMNSCLAKLV